MIQRAIGNRSYHIARSGRCNAEDYDVCTGTWDLLRDLNPYKKAEIKIECGKP